MLKAEIRRLREITIEVDHNLMLAAVDGRMRSMDADLADAEADAAELYRGIVALRTRMYPDYR